MKFNRLFSKHFPKKIFVFTSILLLIASLFVVIKLAQQNQDNRSKATNDIQLDYLTTFGSKIVKKNNKEVVVLKGFNIGSWLSTSFSFMPLMNNSLPLESRKSPNNNIEMNRILALRFGVDEMKKVNKIFRDNWITTDDIDKVAASGANVVRLPFEWTQFLKPYLYDNLVKKVNTNGRSFSSLNDLNSNVDDSNFDYGFRQWVGWCADAGSIASTMDFSYLDWAVREFGKRGIYVIPDLHLAPGGQNRGGDRLRFGINFWKNSGTGRNDRNCSINIWKEVVKHFKGNPVIAGYDILNEPGPSTNIPEEQAEFISFYEKAYKEIRSIDPDHIIIMEALVPGGVGVPESLPNPASKGWKNVVYSTHDYYGFEGSNESVDGNQLSRIAKENTQKTIQKFMKEYNVPWYLGEFSFYDKANVWSEMTDIFNKNGVSYTAWTYKGCWNPWMGLMYYHCLNRLPDGTTSEIGKKVNLVSSSLDEIKRVFGLKSSELMSNNNKGSFLYRVLPDGF